ncbi:MAG: PQQ-dependent sugar dehydrogenase, partial [Chthoniobacterales bacterium]
MNQLSLALVAVAVFAAASANAVALDAPTPTATPTRILPLIQKGPYRVALQQIAANLSNPVDLQTNGDGRLFVVEQTGKIRLIKNGALVATPFLDVSARIVGGSDERGLLGLAFHPGYNNPNSPGFRKFYTYTSEAVSGPADFTEPNNVANNHQSVVAEWKQSASNSDIADPATRREILRVDEPQANHNGGQLAFRLADNDLYISLGDGGAGNDVGPGHNPVLGNGQDLTVVLGKILRINPLAPALTPASPDPISANGKYRVPATNPFLNSTTKVHETYAYGFRNPYRFSFDATTDQLIVGDVGQRNIEEVDIVTVGKNYGWNRKEGSFLFDPSTGNVTPDPAPNPALIDPVLEYSHADGNAIIGGVTARGSAVPALAGQYVFGDFIGPSGSGRLFNSDLVSDVIQEIGLGASSGSLGNTVRGFGTDDHGDVYVIAGNVLDKFVSIAPAPALVNLSTRLNVGTGENVLIAGFIVTGSADEEIILRGLGPSLNVAGVPLTGRLADPTLELHDATGALLATNDNWMSGPDQAEIMNLGLAPDDALESALVGHLLPGNYTAVLRGAQSGTGVGLVELYALTAPANPANISTRGFISTGESVMIGGFIVGGTTPRNVILRAIGPSLAGQG